MSKQSDLDHLINPNIPLIENKEWLAAMKKRSDERYHELTKDWPTLPERLAGWDRVAQWDDLNNSWFCAWCNESCERHSEIHTWDNHLADACPTWYDFCHCLKFEDRK